jgi:chromosome segregation ATPase
MSGSEGAKRPVLGSGGPSQLPVRREAFIVGVLGVLSLIALSGIALGVAAALGMGDQLERARNELADLEQRLPVVQARTSEAEATLLQKEQQLTAASQSLQDAYATLSRTQVEAANAQRTIDSAREVKAQLEVDRKRLAELKGDVYSGELDVQRLGSRTTELQTQADRLIARITELGPKAAEAETAIQRGKDAVEQRAKALVELQAIRSEVDQLTAARPGLDAEIVRKTAEVASKIKELSDTDAKLGQLRQDINTANSELATTAAKVVKSQADLQVLEQRISELNGQQSSIQAEVTRLRSVKQELQGSIDALEARLAGVKAEVAGLESSRQQLEASIAGLNSIKKTADALDQVFANLAKTIDRINALKQSEAPGSQPSPPASGGGGSAP